MTCFWIGKFGEERALDDVPVALKPRPDQLRVAGGFQLGDVAGIVFEQRRVVGDARRDEDAGQADIVGVYGVGAAVDGPCLDPVVAGPAGVAGGPELAGHASELRSVAKQLEDRAGLRVLRQLLDIEPRQRPALIVLRVLIVFEVGALQPRAVGHLEVALPLLPRRRRAIHGHALLDGVLEVFAGLADHQALGVGAVVLDCVSTTRPASRRSCRRRARPRRRQCQPGSRRRLPAGPAAARSPARHGPWRGRSLIVSGPPSSLGWNFCFHSSREIFLSSVARRAGLRRVASISARSMTRPSSLALPRSTRRRRHPAGGCGGELVVGVELLERCPAR